MLLPWYNYKGHEAKLVGKRKKVDNNIYSFDIETTSYLILYGEQKAGIEYEFLSEKEQEDCEKCSCMYIWQFSINDVVYYGRTWQEFKTFLNLVDSFVPEKKIIFIHELPFEFHYLKSYFNFSTVFARNQHKPMKVIFEDLNFEMRCTRQMSNCKLAYLPKLYNLPVDKKVGDLDYSLIRHSKTPLTEKELGYCEYDCLVIYYYILEELKKYERVDKIPMTSTGHVRRELKELIEHDWKYKSKVYKAINTEPKIYNLLIEAFAGGYTHSNFAYTNEILKNVDSWDFTSSYPYVLVTHKFPMTAFRPCKVKTREEMLSSLAYILVVKFKNIKSKYYNNFISNSKCRKINNAKYDNGRIISAEEIEIVLTDVDFYFILDSYNIESYEITECYFSQYGYLPKQFIEFVLDKYVDKTKFKNVEGKEVEYNIVKQMFNALYGMCVTNNIRNTVLYDNESKLWSEEFLTNEEIEQALDNEKKKCFLSFSWRCMDYSYSKK